MKKFFAEFIGTFVLVLFACGAAVVTGCSTDPVSIGYLMTALAFGLVIVAMAYSIGNVSGCHINPAVSLGVLLTGGMTVKDFFVYIIAQFLGATAGAGVLGLLLGSFENLGQNGLYKLNGNDNIWLSLLVEIILTCVFVLVILCVTTNKKHEKKAGLIIGLTLTLVHIFGIHFTGTSVNPARSFGPALLSSFASSGALSSLWVFIVAPLVGGALAAGIYTLLIKGKKKA